jgi:hypothetical protein
MTAPGTPASSGAPTPTSGAAPSSGAASSSPVGADALKALVAALACENAAIWCYGLIAAWDSADKELIAACLSSHQARRDQTAAIVTGAGGTAAPPAPAYQVSAVTDTASARKLALSLEADCASAWYAVIGNTDISDLRGLGLSGLTDAATFTTRFKIAAKINPSTVPLPGRP